MKTTLSYRRLLRAAHSSVASVLGHGPAWKKSSHEYWILTAIEQLIRAGVELDAAAKKNKRRSQ